MGTNKKSQSTHANVGLVPQPQEANGGEGVFCGLSFLCLVILEFF